jgi:hypothetical protein
MSEQNQRKIIVSEVRPPIPTKDFDYCAFYEDDEERGEYGWGSTPDLAIADLNQLLDEGFYTRPERSEATK